MKHGHRTRYRHWHIWETDIVQCPTPMRVRHQDTPNPRSVCASEIKSTSKRDRDQDIQCHILCLHFDVPLLSVFILHYFLTNAVSMLDLFLSHLSHVDVEWWFDSLTVFLFLFGLHCKLNCLSIWLMKPLRH
jgi:hypothetical protein